MTVDNKTALQISTRQLVLRRLGILTIVITVALAMYAMAGFWLAPYIIAHYLPPYAAERLHVQIRLGKIRLNPFLFTFEARDISLRQGGDVPLLTLKRIFIEFEPKALFHRVWSFADLELEGPMLNLVIGKDGRMNLARLANALAQSGSRPQNRDKGAVLRLVLKHMALFSGAVHLADRSGLRQVSFKIAPVTLELKDISTLPEHSGVYALSATLPSGGALRWHGNLSLEPIAANGVVELKDFKLAVIWNFLHGRLNIAEPGGVAQFLAGYAFAYNNGKTVLQVNPINLTVRAVSLTGKTAVQPVAQVEDIKVSDGRFDLMRHQLVFPVIAINGVMVTARVDKNGLGNWEGLVNPAPESHASKSMPAASVPVKQNSTPWRISIGRIDVTGLDVRYSDASRTAPVKLSLNLSKLSLADGEIDLGQQETGIKSLALTDGEIIFERGFPDFIRTSGKASVTQVVSEEDTAKKDEPPVHDRPWRFALNRLSMAGFHIGFVDHAVNPALVCDLIGLQAEVKDFGDNGGMPVTFDIQSQVRQGGLVNLSGSFLQPGGRIDAQVMLSHLNLKLLQPLVVQHTALTLVSGDLSANMHLSLVTGGLRPSVTVKGEANIGRLLLNEADTGGHLLSWKELAVKGLDFSLNPDHLAINEVRVLEPGAKIIIFKDKSLNLSKVIRPTNEIHAAVQPDKQSARPETGGVDRHQFPVAVKRIGIENGVIDFADLSLVLPFATRIEQFKGAASGVSIEPASRVLFGFEGRVGEFGQAKVTGSLIPSDPRRFTDISVIFRNVVMPPLSPYSATFAGRKIASGKLNLDLEYKIKNSEMLGKNKVVLQDFTLGERVKSPGAMDLPLDLAVALLTDNEGKIDIAVPVRGDLDHPEFSYGRIIRQALFNLLSKIVTSPFRAIAGLFGGNDQNLDAVMFEPGRSDIAPPEQEKLKNVAKALAKRKQLVLIVHGGFDPEMDGTAIKSAHLRRAMAQKMGVRLEKDEDPGPVAYDNAGTQRSLELLAGDKVLAAFQAEYEGATGRKARRVNPAFALIGKASKDTAFYQALFEYLVKTTALPQTELQTLAEKRSTAVMQELAARGGVDPSRITAGDILQTKGHDKEVPVKLELVAR
ncbi:MAG: DUF748 domain-containing protein [Dissulfurimicrobium sp.]|uniref:DUF748 domain-containing protein n=1 Tax=Dissulfurimicrobium sp. TaxID=2022436 RepID=UPI0040495991